MKKTNTRVRRNGGSKAAPFQVPKAPDSSSAPTGTVTKIHTAVPMTASNAPASVFAIRLIDRFDQLRCRTNDAGALALLQAGMIKQEMKEFGGWEDLDVEGFNDGCNGLAHEAFVCIAEVWRSLREMYKQSMERLRTMPNLISIGPRERSAAELAILQVVGLGDPLNLTTQIENAVSRLNDLLRLQSSALRGRAEDNWQLVSATGDELSKACDNLFEAAWQFEKAVIVIEQAQLAERRAA